MSIRAKGRRKEAKVGDSVGDCDWPVAVRCVLDGWVCAVCGGDQEGSGGVAVWHSTVWTHGRRGLSRVRFGELSWTDK